MKIPSRNAPVDFLESDIGSRTLSRLLWAAFPGRSETEVAERASLVLGVTEKQARNWLRGIHDAKARHVMALIAIIGFEKAMGLIERRGV